MKTGTLTDLLTHSTCTIA